MHHLIVRIDSFYQNISISEVLQEIIGATCDSILIVCFQLLVHHIHNITSCKQLRCKERMQHVKCIGR